MDYGGRIYDPRLGRWLSLDPSAKKFPSWNPYNFCLNNPIVYSDPSGNDPITSIFEALVAFGVEAGLDFLTSVVLENEDPGVAFDHIKWGGASFEGAKVLAMATFLPPGSTTAAKLAKLSKSKIGKITGAFVDNLVSEAMKKIVSGEYNNDKGEFDYNLLIEDFDNLVYQAGITTLVEQGMGSQAEKLYEKLKKSNAKLAKQYEKLFKAEIKGSARKTIEKKAEAVNKAGKTVVKDAVKAFEAKATDETAKKIAEAAAEEAAKAAKGTKGTKKGEKKEKAANKDMNVKF